MKHRLRFPTVKSTLSAWGAAISMVALSACSDASESSLGRDRDAEANDGSTGGSPGASEATGGAIAASGKPVASGGDGSTATPIDSNGIAGTTSEELSGAAGSGAAAGGSEVIGAAGAGDAPSTGGRTAAGGAMTDGVAGTDSSTTGGVAGTTSSTSGAAGTDGSMTGGVAGTGGAGAGGVLECPPVPPCNWCGGEMVYDAQGCPIGWVCANGADPCSTEPCTSDTDCGASMVCDEVGLCWPDEGAPTQTRVPVSGGCARNLGECTEDSDCTIGGCGLELCYTAALGPVATTCECTAPEAAGCGCVDGLCTWWNPE